MGQKADALLELTEEVGVDYNTIGSCSRVLSKKCFKSIKKIKRNGICQICSLSVWL